MRNRLRQAVRAGLAFFLLAAPAFAHHAFEAEFTQDKPISITGVIARVDWINPHAYVYLDVKDPSGAVVSWSFETLPPGMLHKGGMNREMLPIGQTITISGFGAKDGSKSLAWIKKIQFADGRVIQVTAEKADDAK